MLLWFSRNWWKWSGKPTLKERERGRKQWIAKKIWFEIDRFRVNSYFICRGGVVYNKPEFMNILEQLLFSKAVTIFPHFLLSEHPALWLLRSTRKSRCNAKSKEDELEEWARQARRWSNHSIQVDRLAKALHSLCSCLVPQASSSECWQKYCSQNKLSFHKNVNYSWFQKFWWLFYCLNLQLWLNLWKVIVYPTMLSVLSKNKMHRDP